MSTMHHLTGSHCIGSGWVCRGQCVAGYFLEEGRALVDRFVRKRGELLILFSGLGCGSGFGLCFCWLDFRL